jgi:hypothetical protein
MGVQEGGRRVEERWGLESSGLSKEVMSRRDGWAMACTPSLALHGGVIFWAACRRAWRSRWSCRTSDALCPPCPAAPCRPLSGECSSAQAEPHDVSPRNATVAGYLGWPSVACWPGLSKAVLAGAS